MAPKNWAMTRLRKPRLKRLLFTIRQSRCFGRTTEDAVTTSMMRIISEKRAIANNNYQPVIAASDLLVPAEPIPFGAH